MKANLILLTGFRGSGKSTMGKLLAQKLDFGFLEMDTQIEKRAAMSISQLNKNGTTWQLFREMEQDLLIEILRKEKLVVSTGGGTFANNKIDSRSGEIFGEENRNLLAKVAAVVVTVCTADTEILLERIRQMEQNKPDIERPILNEIDAKVIEEQLSQENDQKKKRELMIEAIIADARKAYIERKPIYDSLSEIQIDTTKNTPDECAEIIMKKLMNA